MNKLDRGMVAVAAMTVLPALFAALAGCAQFKVRFARRPAPPAESASAINLSGMRPAIGGSAAHYKLARHYLERGRHHEAAKEFKKAIEADPSNAKAWNGLGVSLDALEKLEDASKAYTEALRIDPSLDYVHNNLGSSLAGRGDREGAAAAFERAIELNPGNAVARGNLAKLSAPVAASAPVVAAAPVAPAKSPAAVASVASAAPVAAVPVTPAAASPAVKPQPTATPVVAALVVPAAPAMPAITVHPPEKTLASTPVAPAPVAPTAPVAPAAVPPAATKPSVGAAASQVAAATMKDVKTEAEPPVDILIPYAPNPSEPRSVRLRVVSVADLRRESPVELANASGSPVLLDEVIAGLTAQGYSVKVVDAVSAKRTRTLILYREGSLQPAYQVAQAFPGYQEMKKTATFNKPDSKVRVLLGSDMGTHRKSFASATAAR